MSPYLWNIRLIATLRKSHKIEYSKIEKMNFLGQVSHENEPYRAWIGEIMTTNSKNDSKDIYKYLSSKISAWNIARNLSRYK